MARAPSSCDSFEEPSETATSRRLRTRTGKSSAAINRSCIFCLPLLYFHFSLISLLFLRPSFSLIILRLLDPNLLPNPADMQSSWPLYYNERRNLQFTKSKFVCKCCLLLFFQTPTRVGYAMKLWQKQDTGKYKNNGTRNESDNINSYRPSETNVYYRPYINTR